MVSKKEKWVWVWGGGFVSCPSLLFYFHRVMDIEFFSARVGAFLPHTSCGAWYVDFPQKKTHTTVQLMQVRT